VTAAFNEAALIEQVITSVVSQTLLPEKWIIVSDGSTDDTDNIVRKYAAKHSFIELYRISEDHPRNFAAQVNAINRGFELLADHDYQFIGNLDADITLAPEYFERLIKKFDEDPKLGLGGGSIYERDRHGRFKGRPGNTTFSVAHACQMFRKECFKAIGCAYLPLPYGGPDAHAEVAARIKGWRVASFLDLNVYHHRRTGSVGGILRGWFRQGKMDYSLGTLPSFEIIKLIRRLLVRPYVIGAAARLAGFLNAYWHREERAVPNEFLVHLRNEQRQRIANLFRTISQQQTGTRI
jgi:glycosyltransferase involved in cell wall biosynthesis